MILHRSPSNLVVMRTSVSDASSEVQLSTSSQTPHSHTWVTEGDQKWASEVVGKPQIAVSDATQDDGAGRAKLLRWKSTVLVVVTQDVGKRSAGETCESQALNKALGGIGKNSVQRSRGCYN